MQLAVQQLSQVTGPWARRRRRSARAAIATARFILAVVTKIYSIILVEFFVCTKIRQKVVISNE